MTSPLPRPGRATAPGPGRAPFHRSGAIGRATAPAVLPGSGPAVAWAAPSGPGTAACAALARLRPCPTPALIRTSVPGAGAQAPARRLRPGVWGPAPAFGKGRGGGDAPPVAGATAPHTITRTAEETYP